ncbi:MAG: AAA family ATPase [Candidatus Poribacteria bacterium]|nr:AAA family ATPase [Candidatus Poribacteria bacterium]
MKLRYLHLQDRPPLQDISITFEQSDILERKCAIHFVVGVNGSGKSRLLQALAEVFLRLEARQLPDFPVTLAYELGKPGEARTIYLHSPGPDFPDSEASLIEFEGELEQDVDWQELAEVDWENDLPYPLRRHFTGDDLPGSGTTVSFLPTALLAYTSGVEAPWDEIFHPQPKDIDIDPTATVERPARWTQRDEVTYQFKSAYDEERQHHSQDDSEGSPPLEEQRPDLFAPEADEMTALSIGKLVTDAALKLAVCAVALKQATEDFRDMQTCEMSDEAFVARLKFPPYDNEGRNKGLRGILNEVGWLWPLTLSLRLDRSWIDHPRVTRKKVKVLYGLAATVIQDPEPGSGRTLVFDLRKSPQGHIAKELIETIGSEEGTAFDVFDQLYRWQRIGLLREITLTLRKHQVDDVLQYEALSDGERMFLSRMALLILLRDKQDALLLLDEPESHFNDYWKRQIIDIIDHNLRNDAHNVVISTHSSIALTDAFKEEIELLQKRDGEIVVGEVSTPTFGADPSEIMIQVFDAPDSIGNRALEYLDEQLDRHWSVGDLAELEHLIRSIGPGYYRSELRTIWRKLRATQDQDS